MRGRSWRALTVGTLALAAIIQTASGTAALGVQLETNGTGSATSVASSAGYRKVRVLYVIPQDRTFRSDYSLAIQNAAVSLQGWYRQQLAGKTFTLFTTAPEICRLPQAADYYAFDSWNKVFADVQGCAPVQYASSVTWVLYVDIVHACNAPGRLGAGTTGLTMLPRQDMDGLIGAPYFDDCGTQHVFPINRYIGGLGHEMGHAFGLPHPPGCDAGLSTCDRLALMWSGYSLYPNTYLRAEEKQHLLVSPFFNALPTRNDFDGDGATDLTVVRPASGTWYVLQSSTGAGTGTFWGIAGDVAVAGDYDGDGKTDHAVYRPSSAAWYVLQTTTGTGVGTFWGVPGDVPVPADYDGDGKTDLAVFRPSTAAWYIVRSTTGTAYGVYWGLSGDLPIPADFDGDGKADPTVFRPSTSAWYQLRSTTGAGFAVVWGATGDVPLVGDYDGDGKADPTVFRPSAGTWYQLRSTDGPWFGGYWGANGDVPIVGDYDGDGKADLTVFRPSTSTWYQLRSLTGLGFAIVWGIPGDFPM